MGIRFDFSCNLHSTKNDIMYVGVMTTIAECFAIESPPPPSLTTAAVDEVTQTREADPRALTSIDAVSQ